MHSINHLLHHQQIDIWQYPLDTEFAGAKEILDQEERIRAERFHFVKHQRRFTVGRAVLRIILARYLNLHPIQLDFSYNAYGKPEVINNVSLQFNLSHSNNTALLAIGQNFPLGVDIEFFSARPYLGIAKQLFSDEEIIGLQALPSRLKTLAFFHIWAQKEALIKACGIGLSYPTKQFNVPILPPAKKLIMDNYTNQAWRIVSFMPETSCSAALCYNPEVKTIRYLSLDSKQQVQRVIDKL